MRTELLVRPHRDARQLQLARGFGSKEGGDTKLRKEAAKCLKEAKGSLEVAQGLYFQSKLRSLKETNPDLWMTLEAQMTALSNKDESARLAHEKLVEYTWDTIAAYLPLTSPSNYAVDSAVSSKLELIAQAASSFKPNASVMDVGCGNGAIVPYLKRAGADLKSYLGMDLSSEMIDAARVAHPGSNFERNNFLTCAPGKSFDTILFNGVVQFFPSIPDALRRAALFLKPGGRIVIAHVNGAKFVRGEKRGNPVTVLTDMPEVAYIKTLGDELGADFIALDEITSVKYSLEDEMYLCVLQMRQ